MVGTMKLYLFLLITNVVYVRIKKHVKIINILFFPSATDDKQKFYFVIKFPVDVVNILLSSTKWYVSDKRVFVVNGEDLFIADEMIECEYAGWEGKNVNWK